MLVLSAGSGRLGNDWGWYARLLRGSGPLSGRVRLRIQTIPGVPETGSFTACFAALTAQESARADHRQNLSRPLLEERSMLFHMTQNESNVIHIRARQHLKVVLSRAIHGCLKSSWCIANIKAKNCICL